MKCFVLMSHALVNLNHQHTALVVIPCSPPHPSLLRYQEALFYLTDPAIAENL
ncbi:hypothetical protein [Vibrio phage Va_178/90_p41]|nr:hypothetical protein [Vibrio phage Va_178/90_p41]